MFSAVDAWKTNTRVISGNIRRCTHVSGYTPGVLAPLVYPPKPWLAPGSACVMRPTRSLSLRAVFSVKVKATRSLGWWSRRSSLTIRRLGLAVGCASDRQQIIRTGPGRLDRVCWQRSWTTAQGANCSNLPDAPAAPCRKIVLRFSPASPHSLPFSA